MLGMSRPLETYLEAVWPFFYLVLVSFISKAHLITFFVVSKHKREVKQYVEGRSCPNIVEAGFACFMSVLRGEAHPKASIRFHCGVI